MPDRGTYEEQLHRLVRLQAMSLVIGRTQNDQILLLNRAGFPPKEIAEVLGTTPNSVRVALTHLRKKGQLKLPLSREEL